MNEEQIKSITKVTVALGGFIEAWEKQYVRIKELELIVSILCQQWERQFTASEWELIRNYGKEKETRPTAEDNASTGQQNLG